VCNEVSPQSTEEPGVAIQAPQSTEITVYDGAHFVTHLRLLDASAAGASEKEMCQLILGIDPSKEPERASSALKSQLARARWITSEGYRHLLKGAAN
jgi:hypothetical protein